MTGAVLLSFAACTESESRTFQADLSVDDISTADFTGDGVSDFVLEARVGTAHNVYLLDGSTDLDFASDPIFRSWTMRAPSFDAQRSLVITEAPEPLLVIAGPQPQSPDDDGPPSMRILVVRLVNLEPVRNWILPDAPGHAWVNLATHAGRAWLYGGTEQFVGRIPIDALLAPRDADVMETVSPPAPSTGWDGVVMAAAGDVGLAIVSHSAVYSNPDAERVAPTGWQQFRDGASWVAQSRMDLDSDGQGEIVGFDIASSRLCALDLRRSASGCIPVPSTTGGASTQLSSVASEQGRDVLLVRNEGAADGLVMNRADLFRSLAFQGGDLQEAKHGDVRFESRGTIHVVPMSHDGGGPTFVLLQRSGQARCIAPSSMSIGRCGQ